MVERSKKRNEGSICEQDISNLLQRYSVKTVLTLLQEVSKVSGEKIDWNSVVQNTATGISSARECQMLWRHLAYGQTPIDQFDNGESPMEDDSDLEYELEAFPAPSREALAEASACVKVLMASECPNDPDQPNNTTIEAPLTINIPSSKNSVAPSDSSLLANAMHGTNICIPVYVQKQLLACGTGGEKRPKNGTSGVNYPPRKKRRGWSAEEDMKLIAAVKQHQGNWVDIARLDFDDRKESELSQRWANLRKKQGNSNVGTSSINSEAQVAAARRAVNMALDMPMSTAGTKSQLQSQKASVSTPDQQPTMVGPTKRPFINPSATNGPDSMVKAAAVAAGARIATPADALTIKSAMKSSSNVQFMHNNNVTKAPSVSRPGEAQKAQGHSVKLAEPKVQAGVMGPTPVDKVPEGNQSEERVEKHRSSGPGNALRVDLPSSEIEDNGKKSTENPCASKEINGNTGQNGAVKQVKQPKLEMGN